MAVRRPHRPNASASVDMLALKPPLVGSGHNYKVELTVIELLEAEDSK
jgi:hypothetical protein